MSVISKRFADELAEKNMREAYLSAQTRTKLTNQIRAIRNQRGWSQGEFAKKLGKPQSNVSRIENREYGSFTLSTLFTLANTFDCGLIVEFVPYDDFLRRTHDLSLSHLEVPYFSSATLEPLCRDNATANQIAFAQARTEAIPISAQSVVIGDAQHVTGYVSRQGTASLNNRGLLDFNGVTETANQTIASAGTSAALIDESKIIRHPRPSVALASGFW
jgi:transcriptional regulator with XRE-family HTH domain